VLREVVLGNKPAALLDASPKGTVPVLVLPNGEVLEQSLEIMLWALRQHDPEHWLSADGQSVSSALALIGQCDGDFKFNLDRYKYPHRFGLASGEAHRAQGALFLDSLNQRLGAHAHLTGVQASLVDAALAPFVRQFAHTDAAWFARQPWPALQTWLDQFAQSAAFVTVMQKYPAWVPGQDTVLFPANGTGLLPTSA
jgi:glutathione S-transferase